MADAVNDDLGSFGLIDDNVRIGANDGSAVAGTVRRLAAERVLGENVKRGFDAIHNALSALRRTIRNVIEDGFKLAGGPAGVTNLHRPCFAQIERISSSVANSPRSASAIEASRSVSSSAVRM